MGSCTSKAVEAPAHRPKHNVEQPVHEVEKHTRTMDWDVPGSDIQKIDIIEWLTDRKLKILPLPESIGRQVEPLLEAISSLSQSHEAEPGPSANSANMASYRKSLSVYLSAYLDSLNKRERAILAQAYCAACTALREKVLAKVYHALNRFESSMIDRNDILFWLRNERTWKMKLSSSPDATDGHTETTDNPSIAATDTFNITPITAADVQGFIKEIEVKLFKWTHLVAILPYADFDRLFDRWSIRLLKLLSEDPMYYSQLTDYFKSPTLEARLALVHAHSVDAYAQKHASNSQHGSRHGRRSKHSGSGKNSHSSHHRSKHSKGKDKSEAENERTQDEDGDTQNETQNDEKQDDEKNHEALEAYLAKRRPSAQSAKSTGSRVTTDTRESESDTESTDTTGLESNASSRPASSLNLAAAASSSTARAVISPRYDGIVGGASSTDKHDRKRSKSGHRKHHSSRHKSSKRDKGRPQSGMLDDVKEKDKDRKHHKHKHHSSRRSNGTSSSRSLPALTPEALAKNAAAQLKADREMLAAQGKSEDAEAVAAAYHDNTGAAVTIEDANESDED